jgi:excinuclease ABC subunit C
MANDNAFYAFNRHKDVRVDEALLQIKDALNLKLIPNRIGAFDISNISGSESVGAFILYEDGKFVKDGYRLFKIKTVKGIDDFAMMGEVVGRYLKNVDHDEEKMPQLILIDGGAGQLKSALTVMKPFGLPMEIAAIAKAKGNSYQKKMTGIRTEFERVYLPHKKRPVYLEPTSASTHVLQKIRDEVHRFAISYHRKLRSKRTLDSPLEKVSGIGKTRRLQLLRHFGSIDAIRNASLDELASLKGINLKIAGELKMALGKGKGEKSGKGGKSEKSKQ